ncbi:MAG: signal peptidase I [Lachnospiraceae bacterium]|nr:signal peptidase I [bacterium]MDY5517428.1 signal peptidase I [Lachnospiraceae bacterium]
MKQNKKQELNEDINKDLDARENGDGVAAPQEEAEEKTSLWKELLSWVEIFVVAVLISLFLTQVVLVNALVPSSSMETLISPGDRLFGNRLAYKFGDPERFDVVIFKYPVDESQNYIKRVIGLPGEKVTIEDAKIYINDSETPLQENYLPEEWIIENDGYVFEVPEDCYLMLGDNRNVSEDARYWAEEAYVNNLADSVEDGEAYTYVSRDKILGKAVFTYWPHFQLLSDYEE